MLSRGGGRRRGGSRQEGGQQAKRWPAGTRGQTAGEKSRSHRDCREQQARGAELGKRSSAPLWRFKDHDRPLIHCTLHTAAHTLCRLPLVILGPLPAGCLASPRCSALEVPCASAWTSPRPSRPRPSSCSSLCMNPGCPEQGLLQGNTCGLRVTPTACCAL